MILVVCDAAGGSAPGVVGSLHEAVYEAVRASRPDWAGRVVAGRGTVGQNYDPSGPVVQDVSLANAGVINAENGWVVRENGTRTEYPQHSLSDVVAELAGGAPAITITPPQDQVVPLGGIHYGNAQSSRPGRPSRRRLPIRLNRLKRGCTGRRPG